MRKNEKQYIILFNDTLDELKSIKRKLDPRTYAGYEKQIYSSKNINKLNNLMNAFQSLKHIEGQKLTKKDLKPIIISDDKPDDKTLKVKISNTKNNHYTIHSHRMQFNKLARIHPNKLYKQTLNFFDKNDIIQNNKFFKTWQFIGTKQDFKHNIDNIMMQLSNKSGSDGTWIVKTFLNKFQDGYVILKTSIYEPILNKNIVHKQEYKNNDNGTCVYDGILKYFEILVKNTGCKKATARLNRLIKQEKNYKKSYTDDNISEIGKLVDASIKFIDLIHGNNKLFNENSYNRYCIEFINNKFNHVELYVKNYVDNDDILEINKEEYQEIKNNINYYVEKYSTLYTIDKTYKIKKDKFKILFDKWKLENNLNTKSIFINDDTYNFLNHYDYSIHRFFNDFEINNELYIEYDLKKAYFNYSNITINKYYIGVPSGSFINCNCDGWTTEDFLIKTNNKLVGFYEIEIISYKSTFNGFKNLGFNIGSKHILYSSTIILLLEHIEIKFINASYAPSVHIPFNDQFLEIDEDDIKFYCKAFGHLLINNIEQRTELKVLEDDIKYYDIIKKEGVNYYKNKNIIQILEPIKDAKSYKHIAYAIHAYTQTLILDEIFKHDINNIFGVKLDSIVFKKNIKINNNIFDTKETKIEFLNNKEIETIMNNNTSKLDMGILDDDIDEWTVEITRTTSDIQSKIIDDTSENYNCNYNSYFDNYKLSCNNDIKFKKIFTQDEQHINNRIIFIGGAGGSGKTTSLINFFNNKLCFSSVSWNLIQGIMCKKDVIGLSINKLEGKTGDQTTEQTNNKNIRYIVLDEATMLKNESIISIIEQYSDVFIFILGDIEKEGFYYQCSNMNVVINPSKMENLQYIKYNKSYRFDKELSINLEDLRKNMKLFNNDINKLKNYFYNSNFKTCIKSIDDIIYNNNDMGISCKKDEKMTNIFIKKGTEPKYFIKTTYLNKNQLRGQEITDITTHSNYEMKLFKTIHSYQGLDCTETNKIIIDLSTIFDYNLIYTALSRARRMEQINIIKL